MLLAPVKQAPSSMNRYGLYELQEMPINEVVLRQNHNRILKPLTMFAPYLTEDEAFLSFKIKKRGINADFFVEENNLSLNEKFLIVNELVKREPETIAEFAELLNKRLKVKQMKNLSNDDQEELISITIQEAKYKWKDIKRVIEDPFMNELENTELIRRLVVNVICICEKLYNFYLDKADLLKSREIFNDEANFSRLKTLLACDLNKFMNIHSLKLHLVSDLKKYKLESLDALNYDYYHAKPSYKIVDIKTLSIKKLTEDFRQKFQTIRRYKTTREHVKDILESMPILETRKLRKLLKVAAPVTDQSEESERKSEKSTGRDQAETKSDTTSFRDEILTDEESDQRLLAALEFKSKQAIKRKRSNSMSDMSRDQDLSQELGINKEKVKRDRFKTTDAVSVRFFKGQKTSATSKKLTFNELVSNQASIAQKLRKDLEELTWASKIKEKSEFDDNLILMTLTSKPDHKKRIREVKEKMRAIDKRMQKFKEEIMLPVVKKPEHVQPNTIETNYFKNFPLRLSDIRVSTRVLRFNITVKTQSVLYNDITREIDTDMVQHLDRNLYIGGEVKEIYDELVKTLEADYLRFDIDEYVEVAPMNFDYQSGYASTILKKHGVIKCINAEMLNIAKKKSPWDKQDIREWNKTPTEQLDAKKKKLDVNKKKRGPTQPTIVPTAIDAEKIKEFRKTNPSKATDKEFKQWVGWWQNHFSTDDYQKFLSVQRTDYLTLINHLYDEKDSNTFDKTDEERKLEKEKDEVEKQRNEMIEDLKKEKFTYEPGVWNANAIFLGGLGKDPLPDESVDPLVAFKQQLMNSGPKSQKFQFFKGDTEEYNDDEIARNKMLESLKEKKSDSPQKRLERIWTLLRMTDTAKLDMVIKYSTHEYIYNLIPAIDEWERATSLIIEREKFIHELEGFEKFASDPNRFFLRGYRGSGAARLDEAVQRENLYKAIDEIQDKLEPILVQIEKKFRDVVTYHDRPYLDKMKYDRLEMLHYLTEERRMKYFKNEVRARQLKTSIVEFKV